MLTLHRPQRIAALAACLLLAPACAPVSAPGSAPASAERSTSPSGSTTPSPSAEASSATEAPTGWGPTEAELAQAQELVSGWTAEQLAGQVIVGRFRGTDPQQAAALVRDLHLGGLSVTTDNVVDEGQVRALTAAVTEAHAADGRDFPPVLGVDQEGGVVSHLRGIATEFPPFAAAGAAVATSGREGERVVREAAAATAEELRDLGFTWIWAPVADVTVGAADPTIGSRSASQDPATAARTVVAAVRGYLGGAVVPTVKHFPGHGGATADSHETLPRLDASLAELRARDLVPFAAAVDAGVPAVMVGHLDVADLAPGRPSSTAPAVYDLLRDDLGFEGVAVTDSLGMGALAGVRRPAVEALAAGADLLLMPADTRSSHRTITEAITSGRISRERAEEAAARVVALQRWQQRVAEQRPLPEDASARAAEAARALEDAAY